MTRRLAWLVAAAMLLSATLVGGVHAWSHSILASLSLTLLVYAAVHARPVPRQTQRVLLAAGGSWLAVGLHLVPVGSGIRHLLQPGFAAVFDESLAWAGETKHALALDSHGAAQAWMVGMSGLAVIAVAHQTGLRSRGVTRTFRALTSAAAVLALLGLAQARTEADSILQTGYGAGHSFFATFVYANHAAVFFAAALPIALSVALERAQKLRRHPPRGTWGPEELTRIAGAIWWMLAPVFLSAAVLTTGSRGGVVSAVVGLGVWAIAHARRRVARTVLATVIGLFAVVGVVGPTHVIERVTQLIEPEFPTLYSDQWSGRLDVWSSAIDITRGAPWAGIGAGSFHDAIRVTKSSPAYSIADHAHNEYLQVWGEFGPVLALVWAGLMLHWLIQLTRLRPARGVVRLRAGVLGGAAVIASSSFIDFPLRSLAVAWLGCALFGVGLALSDRRRDTPLDARPLHLHLFTGGLAASLALWFVGFGFVDDADAQVSSGTTAYEAGDPRAAETHFRAALRDRPLTPTAHIGLARVRLSEDDSETAVALLETATRVHPTLPQAHLGLARVHQIRGEHAQSRASYRSVLALNIPEEYLREALRAPGAISHLEDVLPARRDRQCEAAAVLARRGHADVAEELFARNAEAIDTSRDGLMQRDISCIVAWSETRLRQGDPEQSMEIISRLGPEWCPRHKLTGAALLDLDRPVEAVEAYETAVSVCNDLDGSVRIGLATARVRAGTPGAWRAFERLERDLGESAEFHRTISRLALETGRTEIARRHLATLIELGKAKPRDVEQYRALE